MSFGFGFGLPRAPLRGRPLVAAIRSLFAANEPGVWYDPSDLSTLFQDAVGTTPVTAVEQPVGLMLDKSKGPVLGPELVVNGDFSSGVTWWAVSRGSISGGVYSYSGDNLNGGAALISQSGLLLLGGRTYELTYQVISVSGTVSLRVANGATEVAATNPVFAAGSYRQIVTLSGAADRVVLVARGSGVSAVATDNISVRELPGNHAYQPTATSRPVLSARVNLLTKTEQFDDAVWEKVLSATTSVSPEPAPDSGIAYRLNIPSAGGGLRQNSLTVSTGVNYKVDVWIKKVSGGSNIIIYVGDAAPAIITPTAQWAKYSVSVTAGSVGPFLDIRALNEAIVVDIWHPDLRVANDGANLPPYQRVNTATDYDTVGFPHYLRFDGVDDWLVTNTITPNTDKAQVFAGLRKLSDAAAGIVLETSTSMGLNNGAIVVVTAGSSGAYEYEYGSRGTSPQYASTTSASFNAPHTGVLTGTADISGDRATLRINGVQAAQNTADQGTSNFLAYPLYIGRRGGTTLPFNGRLYSLIVRFGSNLPTATIENTEKYINTKTRAY